LLDTGSSSRVRIGCDLQPVADVSDAIATFGARYLDRVYTPAEQAGAGHSALAARFAAKEAVLKLLGRPDGIDLVQIEVTGPDVSPQVSLHGAAADLAMSSGIGDIELSLTHTHDLAMAVAVAAEGAAAC
jgi:holo-[acyl-carrier protein] synthase